jgi:hypothetical protein
VKDIQIQHLTGAFLLRPATELPQLDSDSRARLITTLYYLPRLARVSRESNTNTKRPDSHIHDQYFPHHVSSSQSSATMTVQIALFQLLYGYWPLILPALFLADCIYLRYFHPLAKVPGPALAACTRLWGLYVFFGGRQHHVHIGFHEKYGSIVRIGPNTVIVNDPKYFSDFLWVPRAISSQLLVTD